MYHQAGRPITRSIASAAPSRRTAGLALLFRHIPPRAAQNQDLSDTMRGRGIEAVGERVAERVASSRSAAAMLTCSQAGSAIGGN
jgi:hypothetical protein